MLDIYPGPTGSYASQLTNINGTLFFSARDLYHGVEPWTLGPLPPAPPATTSARVFAAIPSVGGLALDPAAFSSAPSSARVPAFAAPPPNSPPFSNPATSLSGQGPHVIELSTADGSKPTAPANPPAARRVLGPRPADLTNLLDWDKL